MKFKLSNKSKHLIKVVNTNFIDPIKETKQINNILFELYLDLFEAYKYALLVKKNPNYYTLNYKQIKSVKDITKPQKFNYKSFPSKVINIIDDFSQTEVMYSFSLFERKIKIYFVIEKIINKMILDELNNYIFIITMWLHIINKYSSKTCSSSLVIYIYLTHLEKTLPVNSDEFVLDEINVNTAFTTTCPLKSELSEIVIFRREEWFKVLIHETFHNFGLDFSDMNNNKVSNYILSIFKVNSNVNLYECYTEFWAEIINSLFCAFLLLKNPLTGNEVKDFLSLSNYFINIERKHSFLQMVKILDFMKLPNGYIDLYANSVESSHWREINYKENTNVLSYYIIKTVLLNKYSKFLLWCKTNNTNLLQFKKTQTNQLNFCKFIESNYNTNIMITNVNKTDDFFHSLNTNKRVNSKTLFYNLRMTICEIV
jgi:hypothetical protein